MGEIEWLKDNVQQQRQQPKLGIVQMRRHNMFKKEKVEVENNDIVREKRS